MNVYIRDALYNPVPSNPGNTFPKQRAVEFEEDLFEHAGKTLNWDTVTTGTRHSYTDLGTPLLEALTKNEQLHPQSMLVLSYWTPEYNPEYSAFGPYFLHRFLPGGSVADVCDRGSLTGYAALKIALSHVRCRSEQAPAGEETTAVVLGLEQNTIVRDGIDHLPVPAGAAAGAIVLSSRPSERCGRLLDAGIVPETSQISGEFRLPDFVAGVCATNAVDPACLNVLTPFDGYPAKSDRYRMKCEGRTERAFAIRHIAGDVSAMRPYRALHGSLRGPLTRERRFALLIDEDVETMAIGWALFEGPQAWTEVSHDR
jgi:hypothetical protein